MDDFQKGRNVSPAQDPSTHALANASRPEQTELRKGLDKSFSTFFDKLGNEPPAPANTNSDPGSLAVSSLKAVEPPAATEPETKGRL